MRRILQWFRPSPILIWGPCYSHRSAGGRALYRLCHHLNASGYSAAMVAPKGVVPDGWLVPRWKGTVGDRIVVYPEVVRNPFCATRVVRWVLNDPGLLGGDTTYSRDEMVFVYDPAKLAVASRAAGQELGPERAMWVSVIDPDYVYPDPAVAKTVDCTFTNKGRALRDRFPLPDGVQAQPLEDLTPSYAALGDLLRRTRTLYSWDHYSNVLREAHISGCDVRVVSRDGVWHDPRHCDCVPNIRWQDGIERTYAGSFRDSGVVEPFIRELRKRWPDAGGTR